MTRLTRKLERRRQRLGGKKPPTADLATMLKMVVQSGAKYSLKGFRGGDRILHDMKVVGNMNVTVFRHPTKKATKGRMCSMTAAAAA